MAFFGFAGGSSGSTTYNQYVAFGEKKGPSSYATGGFEIDLSVTYSSLNFLDIVIKKGGRGTLGATDLDIALNSPSAGKATIKVSKERYDRATSIGDVANQPSGVTVQSSSGATTSSESSHTHTIDHDHGSTTSSAATNTGAAVNANVATLNQNVGSHTHAVDPPAYTGSSGAGSSHNHADNNIYAHTHTNTYTATNVSIAEIANATDLSATTWLFMASGVRI